MGWFTSKEEDRAEELQQIHNQGQTDASNGVHQPPHDAVSSAFATILGGVEKMEEDNDTYQAGHDHVESQKGNCFLTTACAQAAGLPDDCYELTVLREFRDTYVRGLDGGEALIQEYYELSPQIVLKLSDEELGFVFETIQFAVAQIGRGEFREAFSTYAALFTGLRDKYLVAE